MNLLYGVWFILIFIPGSVFSQSLMKSIGYVPDFKDHIEFQDQVNENKTYTITNINTKTGELYKCTYDKKNNPINGVHIGKSIRNKKNDRLYQLFYVTEGSIDSTISIYLNKILGKGIYENGIFISGLKQGFSSNPDEVIEIWFNNEIIEEYRFSYGVIKQSVEIGINPDSQKITNYDETLNVISSGTRINYRKNQGTFYEYYRGMWVYSEYLDGKVVYKKQYYKKRRNEDTYEEQFFKNGSIDSIHILYKGQEIASCKFKNKKPHNGTYIKWGRTQNLAITCKEGVVYEKNLLNDDFSKTPIFNEATFKKGKPYSGLHKEGYTFSEYENGLKNGISYTLNKNDTTWLRTYRNDTLHGRFFNSVRLNRKKQKVIGLYTNGKVINGLVHNNYLKGLLKNGKKEGLFTYHNSFYGTAEFKNDIPISMDLKSNKFDISLSKFDEGQPINGYIVNNDTLATKYINGEKQKDKIVFDKYKAITYIYNKKQQLDTILIHISKKRYIGKYINEKMFSGYFIDYSNGKNIKLRNFQEGEETGDSIIINGNFKNIYKNGTLQSGKIKINNSTSVIIENGITKKVEGPNLFLVQDTILKGSSNHINRIKYEAEYDHKTSSGYIKSYCRADSSNFFIKIKDNIFYEGNFAYTPSNQIYKETAHYFVFDVEKGIIKSIKVILPNWPIFFELKIEKLHQIDFIDLKQEYFYSDNYIDKIKNNKDNSILFDSKKAKYKYQFFYARESLNLIHLSTEPLNSTPIFYSDAIQKIRRLE